jgi:large subunit ribosomal protein L5
MADTEQQEGKKAKAPKPQGGGGAPMDARAEKKAAKAEQAGKKADGKKGDGEKKARAPEERVTPRLRTQFDQVIKAKLREQFGYGNVMQVPSVTKVVLNMGIGEGVNDRKKVEAAAADLAMIAGQKPVITRSRKAISTYKLRENQPIGCKVTLRKARMYEFLDRLISVAMPRIRDFRGVSRRAFDGRGNYNLGVKEQIIFPEINFDQVDAIRGLDISITTTARTDDAGRALLEAFKFPLRGDR